MISWNSAAELAGALDSLAAQDHADLEVVVVDNASADASRQVAARYADVRVVANPTNRGFAGAANQGAALAASAAADALLTCNPDVLLDPGYVRHAAAALAAEPRRAAVQGKLWRGAGPGHRDPGPGARVLDTTGHQAFTTRLFRNRGEGQPDTGQFDVAGPVFGVSGAVALYRLAAQDDIAVDGEVFDEDLFAFWEDVDLDWRLQGRDWHAWFEPAAQGWHERGGAGPRRSPRVEELNFANRFLVIAKNDDVRSLVRAAPGVVSTSVLKAGELALTVPTAFLRSLPRLGLLRRMLAKRHRLQARALVPAAAIAERWFEPFDYRAWIATWWRRVRGTASG